MDKKLKRKWVDALRSGKYKQGLAQLRTTLNAFCCLGVLCDVQGRKWRKNINGEYVIGSGEQEDQDGEVNAKLHADVGGYQRAKKLMSMNDGFSFKEIADYIEESL